jgi:hypothetical protein
MVALQADPSGQFYPGHDYLRPAELEWATRPADQRPGSLAHFGIGSLPSFWDFAAFSSVFVGLYGLSSAGTFAIGVSFREKNPEGKTPRLSLNGEPGR